MVSTWNSPNPLRVRKYKFGAVAFVGDVHIGPRGESLGSYASLASDVVLRSFTKDLFFWLKKKQIQSLVIAGDLFDRTTITPSVVRKVRSSVYDFCTRGGNISVIAGNHDRSTAELGFDYLPDVNVKKYDSVSVGVIDCGNYSVRSLFIPYVPGGNATDYLKEHLLRAINKDNVRVVVGHFGIYGNDAPPWSRADPWYVDADWLIATLDKAAEKNRGSYHVFTAHHHTHSMWLGKRCVVANIGALNPRSFDQQGLDFGDVAVLDGLANEKKHQAYFHMDAVPGIRFYEDAIDCVQACEVSADNWYFVSETIPETSGVFLEPKKLSQVKGAVTLLERGADYSDFEADVDVTVTDKGEAMHLYIKDNEERFARPARALQDSLAGEIVRNSAKRPLRRRRRR